MQQRALIIRPDHDRQEFIVSEAQLPVGEQAYDAMASLLGAELVERWGLVGISDGDPLWRHQTFGDEEALFRQRPGYLWHAAFSHMPLAGSLIITGVAGAGEIAPATVDVPYVQHLLRRAYVSPAFAYNAARLYEKRFRYAHPNTILVGASEFIDPTFQGSAA